MYRQVIARAWNALVQVTDSGLKRRPAPLLRGMPVRRQDVVVAPEPREYARRIEAEQAYYEARADVHDLPEIYHYWSNRYLKPILEQHAIADLDSFFVDRMERACRAHERPARFVSIGAGNCDSELRFAQALKRRGVDNFTLECLDINAAMLSRGRDRLIDKGPPHSNFDANAGSPASSAPRPP